LKQTNVAAINYLCFKTPLKELPKTLNGAGSQEAIYFEISSFYHKLPLVFVGLVHAAFFVILEQASAPTMA